ncbi:hypothetical protein [Stutzerimonas nitrititolerans]|uniref:hypothetical protein n=1 Tax=Stutzerimonas nitrititolerans TaxID=2482751 RepID=UPI0028AA4994|nr:hypothetical protein [Stutzerimonas nitrititolerans]
MHGDPVIVGIDVAKAKLDIFISQAERIEQYAYQPEEVRCLLQTLQALQAAQPELIVLEATGGLERRLVARRRQLVDMLVAERLRLQQALSKAVRRTRFKN